MLNIYLFSVACLTVCLTAEYLLYYGVSDHGSILKERQRQWEEGCLFQ